MQSNEHTQHKTQRAAEREGEGNQGDKDSTTKSRKHTRHPSMFGSMGFTLCSFSKMTIFYTFQ